VNYELLFSLGAVGAAVVLAILYGRAAKGAAQTETYKRAAEFATRSAVELGQALAQREEYTRELEKTIIGSLPAGKLAERLNRVFAERAGRGASTVPIAVRAPGKTVP
jgi:hypothetical protein